MNANKPRHKILFLCTGNFPQSILPKYQLKAIAPARFETYGTGASRQAKRRLELLGSWPFEKLDALRLEAATTEIGAREKIQIGCQTPA